MTASIWIRPGLPSLQALDTVVFDMDGVLWQTDDSYDATVGATVNYMLEQVYGLPAQPPVSDAEVAAYRAVSGFNHDGDLSFALLVARLRVHAGLMPGEHAVLLALPATANGDVLSWVRSLIPPGYQVDLDQVYQVFDELYWGEEYFTRYFGPPRYARAPGFVQHEQQAMPADLPQRLAELGIPRLGIITGRNRVEARPALESSGLDAVIPAEAIVTRERFIKPDPAALQHVVHVLGARSGLYLGDTRDDLDLVLNYRSTAGAAPFYAVAVTDASQHPFYQEAGADAIIDHVACLPELLRRLRRKDP